MIVRAALIGITLIISAAQAQACLPAPEAKEYSRKNAALSFEGIIVETRQGLADFGKSVKCPEGCREKITLGTIKITRRIKGEIPDIFVVSEPVEIFTSCDHPGVLERLRQRGQVLEFNLGEEGVGVEPMPRVDHFFNMHSIGRR